MRAASSTGCLPCSITSCGSSSGPTNFGRTYLHCKGPLSAHSDDGAWEGKEHARHCIMDGCMVAAGEHLGKPGSDMKS